MVIVASYRDDTDTVLPTGYTNGQNGAIATVRYRWSYKFMPSTPDTSITGLDATNVIHIAMVFRGVNTTTTFDVTTPAVASSGGSGTGMPNPPSITPVTNGVMIVALGYLDDDIITATAPTNYTLARTGNYGSSGAGGTVMCAYRRLATAAAEDPGVFGGGGSDDWVGATIGLRPAGA